MPLPAPQTWEDGEEVDNIPTAEDLNLDWRDSFSFLLGITKPMFVGHTTSAVSLTGSTVIPMPIHTELLKRGGIIHAANDTKVYVPYTGQYQGFAMGSFTGLSASTIRTSIFIHKNGLMAGTDMLATADQRAAGGTFGEWVMSFTINLVANDYIEFYFRQNGVTTSTPTAAANRPRFGLWYVGDNI
jgi:hypothetical protein